MNLNTCQETEQRFEIKLNLKKTLIANEEEEAEAETEAEGEDEEEDEDEDE